MQNCPNDFGSLSLGRGKRFRQYYPQFRSKFNITEEIEKRIGTAHRLDNFNLNKVSNQKPLKQDDIEEQVFNQKPPKKDDIEEQFEDFTIETSGWVPMEYRKYLNKSHPVSQSEPENEGSRTEIKELENKFEIETKAVNDVSEKRATKQVISQIEGTLSTGKAKGQTNSNEESVPSSAYNTALSSSENSFETAEENVSNGEIRELKNVDVKKKDKVGDVITLRAFPVKASTKNAVNNSNKSEVLSFKAKLVTRK